MANNDHPPTPDTSASSGKRYASVEHLLRGQQAPKEVTTPFTELSDATRVTRLLAQRRVAHGLTQKDMGEALGITQGAVSKLEAGRDEDLKLSEVCLYARALNERIGVVYGPPLSHAQAINNALNVVKYHMLELAKTARNDAEMDNRMNKFFGDTFAQVMDILASVYDNLPNGIEGCEFTKEVIYRNASNPTDISMVPKPGDQRPQLVNA